MIDCCVHSTLCERKRERERERAREREREREFNHLKIRPIRLDLHGNGLTLITALLFPSIISSPLSSLDMNIRIITFIKASLLNPPSTSAVFECAISRISFIEGKQEKQCQHFLKKENVNITYCVKMQCAEKRGYVDFVQVTFNCVA